ncbi:MAG: NADH-quinone oxidoreductase subunit C [Candidatus Scalindua sp.]|nr:NADH-quinone oxidoreductase subunit C [Candidatus Scalindua sp.]MCR4344096.1 NADH-quinone oxidoreductase subunit C [Candidatus Scalindua sp.]
MPENEEYKEVGKSEFRSYCIALCLSKKAVLRLMFATDERETDNCFKIYAVFSEQGTDIFHIPFFKLREDDLTFRSITDGIPAAHWYEREIMDMFGLVPKYHPDPRRLVFHDSFPADSHPLRKDWEISEKDLKEWGEGMVRKVPYDFLEVEGEGVYEIPVGPVHAGIIEPGHFRISAVGETILYLETRMFYTHKGIEKHFEGMSFHEGVKLAERVSGTSTFSHSTAYCMAVERMAGITITEKAKAIRTFLLELERLYNHIGDIGFLCAGTGLTVGNATGSKIKERLLRLNDRLTKSRFLRGINTIGGVTKDIFLHADDISLTIDTVAKEYKGLMKLLLGSVSHIERLENAGILSKNRALKLGVTGIAAKASGIDDDIRSSHPHLIYNKIFEPATFTRQEGDVFARMMARAEETKCSMHMIKTIIEGQHEGDLQVKADDIPPNSHALGYTETPRGSVFYWVKSDGEGRPLRVKLRSPSFCNWPSVPFAIQGNIVPDLPLCNKSFNLSYSGCNM